VNARGYLVMRVLRSRRRDAPVSARTVSVAHWATSPPCLANRGLAYIHNTKRGEWWWHHESARKPSSSKILRMRAFCMRVIPLFPYGGGVGGGAAMDDDDDTGDANPGEDA